jgi:hypothetical protein
MMIAIESSLLSSERYLMNDNRMMNTLETGKGFSEQNISAARCAVLAWAMRSVILLAMTGPGSCKVGVQISGQQSSGSRLMRY